MLLNLENSEIPMKLVYLLSEELKSNPKRVALTQALTLDKSRPNFGLKGTYGLFGSQQWWDSIENGKMPLQFISGTIERTYVAGQDPSPMPNSFTLLLENGSKLEESIYSYTKKEDNKLFNVGSRVEIVYALDELKIGAQRNFGEKYNEIVLEMAVSLEPVK